MNHGNYYDEEDEDDSKSHTQSSSSCKNIHQLTSHFSSSTLVDINAIPTGPSNFGTEEQVVVSHLRVVSVELWRK